MMTYDICCVGHITLDKVVTTKTTAYMSGGTSYYFSNAICNMDVRYALITSLAATEVGIVKSLRAKGIQVEAKTSAFTVYFENIYGENQDQRAQRVLQKSDPFTVEQLQNYQSSIYHLGPLLEDDMPVSLLKNLASKGKVSLDVQGFLRKVEDYDVHAVDWPEKKDALPYVYYLKANEFEMEVLTGQTDVYKGAMILRDWGVNEVIITLGSKGSVIYSDSVFYNVPAYTPVLFEDTTGCGDTYMAGYLYQRLQGMPIQHAGEFAAAMATLKIERAGPFTGNKEEVYALLGGKRLVVNSDQSILL